MIASLLGSICKGLLLHSRRIGEIQCEEIVICGARLTIGPVERVIASAWSVLASAATTGNTGRYECVGPNMQDSSLAARRDGRPQLLTRSEGPLDCWRGLCGCLSDKAR